MFISYHSHHKKKSPGQLVKPFFTLLKLNITFYFKCYLYHNCCVNLNWNSTQLYSPAKPLHNAPSSVFWLANFCFLSFLFSTSKQKWEKNWFVMYKSVYVRNVSKDITVSVSKPVHKSCSTNQSCIQRSQNPHDFEKVYYLSLSF